MERLKNKTINRLKYDLVRSGLISYEQLSFAENESKDKEIRLAEALINLGFINEETLLGFLETKLHIPYVDLDDYALDKNCLKYITRDDAKKYKLIPLFKIENVLTIAMADPLDLFVVNSFIDSLSFKIEPIICSEEKILQAIEKNYSDCVSGENLIEISELKSIDWRKFLNSNENNEEKSRQIIEAIICQALSEQASEIILENTKDGLGVSFRKNNKFENKGFIPILLIPSVLFELKKTGNLDPLINELPQLGSAKLCIEDKNLRASISTFPTIKGERVVIRLYQPPKKLEDLISRDEIKLLMDIMEKSGIFVVAGNAGSGKTSFIYSLLSYIDKKDKSIMTVESVVKYELNGINQCELNESVCFNVEKALSLIKFQNPDIVFIEDYFPANFDYINFLAKSGKVVILETLEGFEGLTRVGFEKVFVDLVQDCSVYSKYEKR